MADAIEIKEPNLFVDVVAELNNGRALEELTEGLRNVVAAAKLTQKKGSVTLTIEVDPASKGDGEIVFLRDKVTVKIPEFTRAAKIFYVDDGNNLVRDDPRQRRMFSDQG